MAALVLAMGALVFQSGCAIARHPAHPAFTNDRVVDLKVGQTTEPRGRYQHSSNINLLTFNTELNPPRRNHWSIDLMYDSPRK